ncbi:ATP-dependent nuclease [Tsukamurella paurometabola]|uniref:AAA family ATPase n=1 Tax=Tsukamurella paurometabola TaxID=2061 RepID=A0ABS5NKI9_TSUPA|nr:ATP-binding protein [Tsukamurella paurometabola]MBS4103913.1 AAA family ATPase [Tsukamurella paurometabola]
MIDVGGALKRKFSNKKDDFYPYLESIFFPYYKALEKDLEISFTYPITALVGANGTNKSSILQAIYAAPEGRSLARFWFSTEVDNIDAIKKRGTDHRFVYRYSFRKGAPLAEVRKYRGKRNYRASDVPRKLRGMRDPDYWETTKRVAIDGMKELPETGYSEMLSDTRDRWNPIKKNVVYLDFRSELSAFDKFIHHQAFDRWVNEESKKRYKVVVHSEYLAKALKGDSTTRSVIERVVTPVRKLGSDETEAIARILGKDVVGVSVVEHRFFGPVGHTVKLAVGAGGGISYSEAHAGSGEYAIVRLVDQVSAAPDRSLILLDEPEVSLHPGAQKKLMEYISKKVLERGHQVVLTTHSPAIVESLPDQAIKVLSYDSVRQCVVLVADGCAPRDAFHHLGQTMAAGTKTQVVVEDELAAEIVKATYRRLDPVKIALLEIIPVQGGADGIVKKVLPSLAVMKTKNVVVLLDGDQRQPLFPAVENYDVLPLEPAEAFDSRYVAARGSGEVGRLKEVWQCFIHRTTPDLFSNSDHGTDFDVMKSCVDWSLKYLRFLPGEIPESLLASYCYAHEYKTSVGGTDWKMFWKMKAAESLHLSSEESPTSAQVLSFQITKLAELPDDCLLFARVSSSIASSSALRSID